MPYLIYDARTKFEIVKRVWRGEKVAPLSREYKISRDSIHRWINGVMESALKSLTPSTPGPKVDALRRLENENEELRSLLQSLQGKLDELSHISHLTVSSRPLPEVRPSQCPECKGSHIVKNGTYMVKGERTSRSLITKEEGLIQRFCCRDCGANLYLVKKN